METLFKTLAIDMNEYKQYFGKYDINPKENIFDPWFDIRVQNLFADTEFVEKVNNELKNKRNELLKYFEKQKGIKNDEKPLFLVDIGWRGTIQDNLAYIFDKKELGGYYMIFIIYNHKIVIKLVL